MRRFHRCALLALSAAVLAACGKAPTDAGAPLAFVPADALYAYANLQPTPAAVTEQWSKRMQEMMPDAIGIYDNLLDQMSKDGKPESAHVAKVLRVMLDELKAHDSWDKLRQIGLKPDALVALYGVGFVPVLRMELGDPAAFKAEIANIETKLGEKLPLAKAGTQEYWQLGNGKVDCAIAVEGNHLVITVLPANAADPLKQTLLGLTRPAQNLAAAGTLQTLAKQYNYSPFGVGFVDVVRVTERLTSGAQGSDADFVTALGLPLTPGADATCKSEFVEIAHKFPRLVAGAEELTAQRVSIGAQLEIEPGLAQEIATAFGAAPGTGKPGEGVVDVSLALPLLKLKDFWLKQADKVAAKPYACAQLKELNDSYAQSKAKVDVTIPPPASDLTGIRFTLDKIDLTAMQGGVPDMAGKLLMASSNPTAAIAMAQLALPPLKDIKLTPDGKPVALPAGMIPGQSLPLFAAMSDKAIAVAAGAGEDASLADYLKATPANDAVFMRMSFSGHLYGLIAQSTQRMKAMLPPEQQAQWEQQQKLMATYEKWIKRAEITLVANKNGIALHETVEQN